MPALRLTLRVAACAAAALVGFAANSLLCRAALRTGDADPWTFTAIRAAMLQLTVPALVALGGAAWLGEPLTVRLVLAGGAILGGVAVAVARR